jgi:hypothetical protein
MDLIEVIQQIIQNGIAELKLTDLVIGTVIINAPLTIQIDTLMQPLPEEALIKTENIMPKSYTGTTSDGASFTVIINQGVQPGDKVVMLRCQHGQRFIVLSKVY